MAFIILLLVAIVFFLIRVEKTLSRLISAVQGRNEAFPVAYEAWELKEQLARRDGAIELWDIATEKQKKQADAKRSKQAKELLELSGFEWSLWNAMSHANARVAAGVESIEEARARVEREDEERRHGHPLAHYIGHSPAVLKERRELSMDPLASMPDASDVTDSQAQ